MSSIHFIGGEKGGVGKSVVSRVLSQFFLDNNLLYAGFDADQSHGTLTRFYPEFTESVNLNDFESADTIIETASEQDINVVVDMPAQSERFLDQWMDENEVSELSNELGLQNVYWYVVDDGMDSARLAAKFLRRYSASLPCVIVRNYGRGEDFSNLEKALDEGGVTATAIMDLPGLHAGTMRKIDKLNLSFWGAGHLTDNDAGTLSMMERQRSRVWLKKAYSQIAGALTAAGVKTHP